VRRRSIRHRFSALSCAVFVAALAAFGAERDAPFTFSSRLTSPGSKEWQVWLTPRIGRAQTTSRVTPRVAVDVGLFSKGSLLFGFDATIESLPRFENSADGNVFAQFQYAPLQADLNLVGLSAFLRVAAGITSIDVEARVGVDKRVGALWLGLNGSIEQRLWYRFRPDIATRLEQSAALRYQFPNNFSFGLESFVRTAFQRGTFQGTAVYGGPQFSMHGKTWWATAGLYPQIAAVKALADEKSAEPLEFRDNERFVFRLTFGLAVP
jgi:hypothetical protein